jgi:hypothetical protein
MSFSISVFGSASESGRRRTLEGVLQGISQGRGRWSAPEPLHAILDFRPPFPDFDENEDDGDADDPEIQQLLARLVGDALPNHPDLLDVCFVNVQGHSKYIAMFADALMENGRPGRRPIRISFLTSALDAHAAGLLSSLLRRDGTGLWTASTYGIARWTAAPRTT